jgi:predicted patatin/cPLA2 family phospholipase
MTMAAGKLFGTRPETAIANIRARFGKNAGHTADGRKLALVVEGGAMRGVFSCGGGVALEALGLTGAFDEVYACSSGAINAAYFLAGQAAYSATIYYDEVNNRQFINPLRIKNILNLDFLFGEVIGKRKPLDIARVLSSPSRLRISITDARTGAGFLVDAQDNRYALLDSLRASATHPLMSERTRRLGDRDCFDGGFANPLPVKDAIDNGCTDLLVLFTRPSTYVDARPGFLLRTLFTWRCARGNAALLEAGEDIHVRENQSRDLALGRAALPPDVNVVTICPDGPLSRTMKNRAALKAAAADGARKVLQAFDAEPDRLVEVWRYFPKA